MRESWWSFGWSVESRRKFDRAGEASALLVGKEFLEDPGLEASRSEVGAESQIGFSSHEKATRSQQSSDCTYFSGIISNHEKGLKNSSNFYCVMN
jgi:hypothetical protein